MAWTYDLGTDVGKIRLMVPDRVEAEAIFTDEEIAGLLALEGSVKGAAALALETIAADEALVQKVQSFANFRTDGARTAEVLLERAKVLREQAATAGRRVPVPATGKLVATAPVMPAAPPDANDPAYGGSPYARVRAS